MISKEEICLTLMSASSWLRDIFSEFQVLQTIVLKAELGRLVLSGTNYSHSPIPIKDLIALSIRSTSVEPIGSQFDQ